MNNILSNGNHTDDNNTTIPSSSISAEDVVAVVYPWIRIEEQYRTGYGTSTYVDWPVPWPRHRTPNLHVGGFILSIPRSPIGYLIIRITYIRYSSHQWVPYHIRIITCIYLSAPYVLDQETSQCTNSDKTGTVEGCVSSDDDDELLLWIAEVPLEPNSYELLVVVVTNVYI